MCYVIKRIDSKGGFVSKTGAQFSYTHNLICAKVFLSIEAAERDRCPGNEVIMSLRDLMQSAT